MPRRSMTVTSFAFLSRAASTARRASSRPGTGPVRRARAEVTEGEEAAIECGGSLAINVLERRERMVVVADDDGGVEEEVFAALLAAALAREGWGLCDASGRLRAGDPVGYGGPLLVGPRPGPARDHV